MPVPETEVTWVKSSLCSADQPSCIEVAAVDNTVLVRDSKDTDPNRVLLFSRAEWVAFRDGLRLGTFDHI